MTLCARQSNPATLVDEPQMLQESGIDIDPELIAVCVDGKQHLNNVRI